jgi:epoxyqueuosine reductase
LLQSSAEKYTNLIKQKSKELGFDFCGISPAGFLEEEAPRLESWLTQNRHGQMSYMSNYFDKRLDPTKLVEGAKSIVSFLLNYYPEKTFTENNYKVSKYAYGKDYHIVIKDKLKSLVDILKKEIGDINGRAFVDSAPVMDKVWAKKSGLGWIGKNSNLISKGNGSFFFIAELILDVELQYDNQIKDYCGSCTRCIDACPTDAIVEPYIVDGSKCISYYTIELKEQIPEEVKGKFENWIFGCDICQDVCPWNSFSQPHQNPEFLPNPELASMSKSDWEEITEDVFNRVFKDSPVKRTKLKGLKRNVIFVKGTD